MKRFAVALLMMAVVFAGCSSGGDEPASSESGSGGEGAGNVITLNVEGKSLEFREAEPWEFTKFELSPGEYWLQTAAHEPELNTLVLYFATTTDTTDALAGERFSRPDYSADNPDRQRLGPDLVINRFTAGGKWYQGYRMSGEVTDVSDGTITVELDSTFLEFDYDEPDYDEEGNPINAEPGREVTVTGTVTLPLVDDTGE